MNAVAQPEIASLHEGGYYAGRIHIEGAQYALIVAPKAERDHAPAIWIPRHKDVPGALSYCDGLANTRAMAEAGSKLAQWSLELRIGGHADWYLPSLDELEICYRAFKPSAEKNSLWSRSGINVSAVPPTYPYTAELPQQTANELFRSGGAEAFEDAAYWTSTQPASGSSYAWLQDFSSGYQDNWFKYGELRARAVRRLPL